MQDVNNDMDDLFRKAAEQYPLKTEGTDWQKVFAGLQAAPMPAAEEKEKKKRRFLWLFLLLPLGLLWAVYYKGDHQPEQQTAVVMKDMKLGNNDSQKSDSTFNKKPSSELRNSNDVVSELSSGEVKGNEKADVVGENKIAVTSVNKENAYRRSMPDDRSASLAFLKNKGDTFSYNQSASNNNVDLANNSTNNQTSGYKNNFSGLQPDASTDRIDMESKRDSSNKTIGEVALSKIDSAVLTNAKTDSVTNSTNNKYKSKAVNAKPHGQTGLYAGLLASFDASTIKLQRINKTGYGLQVLIGYHFPNRLSIESGLGGTVKEYYSKGKYFDKKKTGIPDIVNIYYTNGYCKMFEVPLNIRYDFASTRKGNLFATAGFSSYFMKKENYSYRGDYRGRVYDTTRYYNNSGANWFSLANVSVGYETKLGRHSSLRIEPYIKVPLHGIGIANLPIASMGISAGFTRKF